MKTLSRCICCWILASPLWQCAPAMALIVAPPATNDNTSPPGPNPEDDPGWANVATRGIGGAVYLGNRWMLTAFHVGPGTTTFESGTFFYQDGSVVRLRNPDNSETDLVMYRLTEDPGLLPLSISTTTPAVGSEVTLIGAGGSAQPTDSEVQWDANWEEVPSGGVHTGYKTTTFRKLWGTNLVENDSDFFEDEEDLDHTIYINPGAGSIILFLTEFDKEGVTEGDATSHEAQAQGHDSGSAVFAKEGDNWVLAGVNIAIFGFDDQPENDPFIAPYGNGTLMADLSRYHGQIYQYAFAPEPSAFLLMGTTGALVGIVRLTIRRRR